MKKFLAISFVAVLATSSAFAQGRFNRAVDASFEALDSSIRQLGITDPARELRVRNSRVDEKGVTHVRFDQNFRGIPVFEGEAITHVAEDGDVTITSALRHVRVNTTPAIDAGTAVANVIAQVNPQGPYDLPTARLEILPAGRVAGDHLVWHVTMNVDNEVDAPAAWQKFVDAHTGEIIFEYNTIETAKPGSGGGGTVTAATGTGNTMYLGPVSMSDGFNGTSYVLQDPSRGGGNYAIDMKGRQSGGSLFTNSVNTWGDGVINSSDRNTAAADAYHGLQLTWDFYKNMFGRNGIDGAGRKTYSRVHYGRNYQNAFWSDSCFCMTYGDGGSTFYPLVSLDVAGHEMSHGVMAKEANLTYSGESGGLNEANSDIFGTMVEWSAGSTKDPGDWWIGEMIYRSNYSTGKFVQSKALRYMDDPHKDGTSPACWSSTLGSLDVHYSSGPANHMFYLLANGGTSKCNGQVVNGIGADAAIRLWYKAMTTYMTSSTNYSGARAACLTAAANSTETNAVIAAFNAINVTK